MQPAEASAQIDELIASMPRLCPGMAKVWKETAAGYVRRLQDGGPAYSTHSAALCLQELLGEVRAVKASGC